MYNLDDINKEIDELEKFTNNIKSREVILSSKVLNILKFIYYNSSRKFTFEGNKVSFENFSIWRPDKDIKNFKLESNHKTYFYNNRLHIDFPDIIQFVLEEYYKIYNKLNSQKQKEEKMIEQLDNLLTELDN
jgi:hypothetical protein